MTGETRALTIRYVSALLVVGALLVAGQFVIQHALDDQEHDAHRINLAGRQRMLSQRLCMLMEAHRPTDDVIREWVAAQAALRAADNPPEVDARFAQIESDHRAMVETRDPAVALAHQDAFLAGMDAIVVAYEVDARDRVIRLRRIELALLALALIVLALEGFLVLRPAVRAIARQIRERATAEHAVREAGELERKRIGQDLHDGLAQQLVGISFLVEAMPKTPEREELSTLLAEAVAQSRQLARGLHSHALEAGGLAAALRELSAHTERVFKITCSVEIAATEPPERMRVHLHRIAGEAVANAAKHARAKHIAIRVGTDDGATVLEVRDDGIGISAPNADGLGLQLMAHRAQVLGGDLRVTRADNGGTIVTCRVPT